MGTNILSLFLTSRKYFLQKLQLLGFEERFSDKVSEIDDKYQDQLQELLRNNIELRCVTSHHQANEG